MKVEVSNGELLDKLTILQIKKDQGLPVDAELELLLADASTILDTHTVVNCFVAVLKSINSQLWYIEDQKRQFEQDNNFGLEFVEFARAVYLLNDERHRVKKNIDRITNSTFTEAKSHVTIK